MKIYLPYSYIVDFVGKKTGYSIAMSRNAEGGVVISCKPNEKIGNIFVDVNIKLVDATSLSIKLSSKTPGIGQIIDGVITFINYRIGSFGFLKIESGGAVVRLKEISQLESILSLISATRLDIEPEGLSIEFSF